ALQLMAEARALQGQNKLPEARQKLNEAQALKASFGPDESSPEQMQVQLAASAQQRCGFLVQQSVEVALRGRDAPLQNCLLAEQQLKQARELAVDFGQDLSVIDQNLAWVDEVKGRLNNVPAGASVGQGTPGLPVPPPALPD